MLPSSRDMARDGELEQFSLFFVFHNPADSIQPSGPGKIGTVDRENLQISKVERSARW